MYQKLLTSLQALHRAHTRFIDLWLKQAGLNRLQMTILFALYQQGECTLNELTALLQENQGNVSRFSKQLAERGEVQRAKAPHDERCTLLSLTPAGVAFCEARFVEVQELFEMSDADLEALIEAQGQTIRRLQMAIDKLEARNVRTEKD